jgi:all-trans-8'-apo-beta-carotenal 15,15'-oxygenase
MRDGNRPTTKTTARGFMPAWNGEALAAAFAARRDQAWTLAYASLDRATVSGCASWTGNLPEGLRGTLFRNGPARHERGGKRYAHRWDGDGMVQRFTLSRDGVSHFGRYVETHKRVTEEAYGRMLFSGFGTPIDVSPPTPERVEASNPANISIVRFNGEYLALWEAGRPYVIDPATLNTLGTASWLPTDAIRPFSAHPKVSADGRLWNFGIDALNDVMRVYSVAPNGRLESDLQVHVDAISPLHDFAVTDHHLVFLFPSITCNRERLSAGASFAESCQWEPQIGMRVLVVNQAGGTVVNTRLPAGCLFHVANAWEDGDTIWVDYMRSPDPSSLLAGWSVMAGEYRHRRGAALTRARVSISDAAASQEVLFDHDAEFPTIRPADTGRRYAELLCVERSQDRSTTVPGYDQVALLDPNSGRRQVYSFGSDWLVEEHVLVEANDSPRPGWAIGTALDARAGQTVVSVFDLGQVERGPVAQARLPYALPLGLHGTFVRSVFE